MLKKIKKSKQIRDIKNEMRALAQHLDERLDEIDKTAELASTCVTAVNKGNYRLSGAALVETRSKGGAVAASMPVKIGGTKIRVGGGVPVKYEEMTVIDTGGVLELSPVGLTFVGGTHTREWEFKKMTGYVDTASNELLIGVENRQKMSGIRYGAGSDQLVDYLFHTFFTVWSENGDDTAVTAWATGIGSESEQGKAAVIGAARPRLEELAGDLDSLGVPADEITDFVGSLPRMQTRAEEA